MFPALNKRCAALRDQFGADVAEAKAVRLAKLGPPVALRRPKREKPPALTSPGLAGADRARRFQDNASTGMRTPDDPDVGLSGGGLPLRTSGYSQGDEDEAEPDVEPDEDNDDDDDEEAR
jgi:hypothetical protein